MVKRIMRDPLFLAQKSVDATEEDKLQRNPEHIRLRKDAFLWKE